MPWQEQSTMDLRRALVEDYESGAFTMVELADAYGVSCKTAYKWVARFEATGLAGLCDRSRRPHHVAEAVAAETVAVLLAARRRRPSWGARKLRGWLIRHHGEIAWPVVSTLHSILRRHGAIRQPHRRAYTPRSRPKALRPAQAANDVWTIDFKGDFRLGDGQRCYPLTLRDLATRYALGIDAFTGPQLRPTQQRLRRVFQRFGLPAAIRSDNGHPFASTGLARLSRLSVWWLRLGIAVEHIAPGHPEQNGSHEQFHRVLKQQTARPPAQRSATQQQRFDRFRREYNTDRPHDALGQRVPADLYQPSPRAFPPRLPAVEYPGHWEPRRVSSAGTIWWRNAPVFLSEALAGETVAFEEVDDGLWTLHYARQSLARWLDRERRLRPLR